MKDWKRQIQKKKIILFFGENVFTKAQCNLCFICLPQQCLFGHLNMIRCFKSSNFTGHTIQNCKDILLLLTTLSFILVLHVIVNYNLVLLSACCRPLRDACKHNI